MSVTWNVTVSVPAAGVAGAGERPQPNNDAVTSMAMPISRIVASMTSPQTTNPTELASVVFGLLHYVHQFFE